MIHSRIFFSSSAASCGVFEGGISPDSIEAQGGCVEPFFQPLLAEAADHRDLKLGALSGFPG